MLNQSQPWKKRVPFFSHIIWEQDLAIFHKRFFSVNNYPTRCKNIQFIYIFKLLYIFRVVSPPIITVSTVSGITETVTVTCRERDWMGTSSASSKDRNMKYNTPVYDRAVNIHS